MATQTYTISTDAVTMRIEAGTEDEAAVQFAASERIAGVNGLAGLLGKIRERGGYATVTDGRGDVAGRTTADGITLFPAG